jgi:hypothetical protein
MAAIPAPINATVQAIYQHYERTRGTEPQRSYLGASIIGKPCTRALWYDFRWASHKAFDGRMLRLFESGHLQEPRVVADLRGIGCTVWDTNPENGQQWNFIDPDCGGHFGGNCDGILTGLPEAPKAPHILEVKTHGAKSFAALVKDGVAKAKPQHQAQMQIYMHWTLQLWGEAGCDRALYVAVNKDTDEIYTERIKYSKDEAVQLVSRAMSVIFSDQPPARMSQDPTWYECKWCDHHSVCHGQAVPPAHCRSCAHSTPEPAGAQWSCGQHRMPLQVIHQREGCEQHRYIPILLEQFAQPVDAQDGSVTYQLKAGGIFANGEAPGYSSQEIHACTDKVMLADEQVQQFRAEFGAKVVA